MKVIPRKDFYYSLDGINPTSFVKDEVVVVSEKLGQLMIEASLVDNYELEMKREEKQVVKRKRGRPPKKKKIE